MSGEQFSLVWNSFPRNLSSGLYTLLTDEQLVDVTLAAEGQILRAHKLILSVCSTYFRDLFKGNSCKHPIVILKDVNYRDLSAMLHFMYQGEVNIKQEDIASFLKVAETLQIKGLTTETNERLNGTSRENKDQNYTPQVERDKGDDEASNSDIEICDESVHLAQEDQCTQNQDVSSNRTSRDCTFVNQNTDIGNTPRREEPTSNNDYMQSTPKFYDDKFEGMENRNDTAEGPLDCTAAVEQLQRPKQEPLDYTLDVEGLQMHNMDSGIYEHEVTNTQRQDFVPDTQLISYNQESQNHTFGMDNSTTTQSNDFIYGPGNYSKGRRTVKGIPTSSLPLETTLRVVSELGPTLRMERGKVIRMYSCPWCLRHFTRKENLKLHVRYIHGPLESLTCKLCGNKYKNSNSLRVHSYLYHNAKRDKHNKSLAGGAV